MHGRVARARNAAQAQTIDASAGHAERGGYLQAAARRGDLWVFDDGTAPRAFLCRDDACFFARPFVSLLVVAPGFRRRGFASRLLTAVEAEVAAPLWTSTNRSNAAMIALLTGRGYARMGEIAGLDEGDPELFFRHLPDRS